jgi:hypothetical protein
LQNFCGTPGPILMIDTVETVAPDICVNHS